MITVNLSLPLSYTEEIIIEKASELLRLEVTRKQNPTIKKLSLNIKDKENPFYNAVVALSFSLDLEAKLIKRKTVSLADDLTFSVKKSNFKNPPVIIGSGPAGLFSALILSLSGANPIILERGERVEERIKSVNSFYSTGELNENSNIQFGEGGAGTFSDGKLKIGRMDKYKFKVLDEFVKSGAPEEILYMANPHLGTDNLRKIIPILRRRTEENGGKFIFNARVTDVICKNGKAKGIRYLNNSEEQIIYSDNFIFATGHSANDIFEMLLSKGVQMEQKPFGIGVRIEHPQRHINRLIYGEKYCDILPPASYKLVTHLKNGRSVYSFCNCPGGSVVCASSSKNTVVTNGMSNFKRDAQNANSAILVSVKPQDFESSDILAGFNIQRRIESSAYNLSKDYKAPVLRMEDFMEDRLSYGFGEVLPTYPQGTVFAKTEEYLLPFITESLKSAFADFEKWMPGFYYPDAVITGAETRSTSPVKILRKANFEAVGIYNIYPCGEGAGYSGGIVSSAVDGIKVAEAIIESNN